MTKPALWLALAAKNPRFAGPPDSTVTLTVRGLRRLCEGSYEAGFEAGQAYPGAAPTNSMPEAFERLFGRRSA